MASFGGVDATSTVFNSALSLTVTVPAHATGLVDVVVTNPDSDTGSLQGSGAYGFEYLPAVTTTYISHDFEDGTLGAFTTDWVAPTVADWGETSAAAGAVGCCRAAGVLDAWLASRRILSDLRRRRPQLVPQRRSDWPVSKYDQPELSVELLDRLAWRVGCIVCGLPPTG